MAIKLHNTLNNKLEEFIAINEANKEVKMYNCGPTVYSRAHIGNLRSFIFADTLKRVLEYSGYSVKQVMNITDVGHLTDNADNGEDKIEKRAKEDKMSIDEIVNKYTNLFFEDLKILKIDISKIEFPRASSHIPEQINIIKKLEEKGYTYTIEDGVYFDTSKFKDYGKLGNIDLEGLKEGARVEVNNEKRNLTDFALWKFSDKSEKRMQEWSSPWGVGFPGWHIECSAMSMKYFGETFDIHTGGIDHIPVHHNNEIAQSESFSGKKYVNYWLHNAFLNIENTKISKSLGNSITIDELVERGVSPLAYKYFLYQAHYRTQTNFTWEALISSHTALLKLIETFIRLENKKVELSNPAKIYLEKFKEFVNNDLDTPKALALTWEMLKDKELLGSEKRDLMLNFDKIFGFDLANIAIFKEEEIPVEVDLMAKMRFDLKQEKKFVEADALRQEIEKMGFKIIDEKETYKIESI